MVAKFLAPLATFLGTSALAYLALRPMLTPTNEPITILEHVGLLFLSGLLALLIAVVPALSIRQVDNRNRKIQSLQSNLQSRLSEVIIPGMQDICRHRAAGIFQTVADQEDRNFSTIDVNVFTFVGRLNKIIASSTNPSVTNVHQIVLERDEGVIGFTWEHAAPTVLCVETNEFFDQFRQSLGAQKPLQPRNRGKLGGNIKWIYSAPIWERPSSAEIPLSPNIVGIMAFDSQDDQADQYFFDRNFQNACTGAAYEIAPYVAIFATLQKSE